MKDAYRRQVRMHLKHPWSRTLDQRSVKIGDLVVHKDCDALLVLRKHAQKGRKGIYYEHAILAGAGSGIEWISRDRLRRVQIIIPDHTRFLTKKRLNDHADKNGLFTV